jgi:hypothetical protein
MFQQPSLGLAEIAWRWTFGAAAVLLAAISFREYFDTLQVSRGDLLLLRTRQPALIAHALAHIFGGSAARVVEAMVVLVLALAVGWIVIAALGRAATLKALLAYIRERADSEQRPPAKSRFGDGRAPSLRLGSLLGLNCCRAAVALAAVVGSFAAFILGGSAASAENPSPGAALLIILGVTSLVWMAWSFLNWVLALAPVFVVAHGRDTFGAIGAVVQLCRSRAGSVFAAGTWFGLAHVGVFFVATTAVGFPLGLAAALPRAVTLGGVLLVTLLYFAVADFLYMGRLAAYVAMVEFPDLTTAESRSQQVSTSSSSAVDPSELILSDLPAPG